MLHLIGIGYKKEDITIEQKEIIKNSQKVFLEYYTSFYQDSVEQLNEYLNKEITVSDRDLIENKIEEEIINPAKEKDVALLIMGDPLIATTHTDLFLRAKEMGVETKVYHNISIGNLITQTGLQFYKLGKITSIPFFNQSFMPRTPFMIFHDNYKMGAHSLFLLDLNPAGDDAYKSSQEYLYSYQALEFLLKIPKIMLEQEELEEKDAQVIDETTTAVICSKLGFKDQKIVAGSIEKLIEYDKENLLEPPICIVIPGDLHDMEYEYLQKFMID